MKRVVLLVVAACAFGPTGQARGQAGQSQEKKHAIRFERTGPAGWGMTEADKSKTHIYYRSQSPKGASAGIWEARANTSDYRMDHAEFMYLLEGEVTVIDKTDGRQESFKAGDALLAHLGADITWKQTTKLRKFYVIFENQPAKKSTLSGQ